MITSHEITRRREELAYELRGRGFSGQQIADGIIAAGLGPLTRQGALAIIKRLETQSLAEMIEGVQRRKAFQEQVLMKLLKEGLQALEDSKKELVEDEDDEGKVVLKEFIRDSYKDTKYSSEVRAVLADLRKLMGLDAPQKIAPTTPNGEEPYKLEVQQYEAKLNLLSVEQLKQLQEISKVWHGEGNEAVPEIGFSRTSDQPGGTNDNPGTGEGLQNIGVVGAEDQGKE